MNALFPSLKPLSRACRWVAAALLTVTLSACGEKKSEGNADGTPSAAEQTLTVYTWGDYFDPELLTKFTTETGIKVDYQTFDNTSELIAKVRSEPGHYDVVIADDSVIASMREFSLLQNLQSSEIPNAQHLDKRFTALPFDPKNEVSLPFAWGTTLIAYRKDVLGEAKEHSWDMLWDPRCKGKVIILDEPYEALGVVLLKLGYNLNTEEPAHIEAARKELMRLFTEQDARMGNYEMVREEMANGRCLVAINYSGDAALDAQNIEGVDFFVPREGVPLWLDNLAITRDTTRVKQAHQFINFMLAPENSAQNTNFTSYASPVKSALPFISKEIAEDTRIMIPDDIMEKSSFYAPARADRSLLVNTMMTELYKVARGNMMKSTQDKKEPESPVTPVPAPESTPAPAPTPAQ